MKHLLESSPNAEEPPALVGRLPRHPARDESSAELERISIARGKVSRVDSFDPEEETLEGAFQVPSGWWLAPGLVDLQVNGGNGIHLASSPERLAELALALPATGVTTFLPTLPSPTLTELESLARAVAEYDALETADGARTPGIHIEGPAISPERAGAHPVDRILAASAVEAMLEVEPIALMTMAPEIDGGLELAVNAMSRSITVAAGHTNGSYEEGLAAIEAGICLMTHCFNASRPIHHRDPGITTAYLSDERAVVCAICDGRHLAPGTVRLIRSAKGLGRLALVTDAIASTKFSGEGAAIVREHLPLGAPLLGGDASLDRCLENFVTFAGSTPVEAIAAASTVPALAAGLTESGEIAPGRYADVVSLNAALEVGATWIAGRLAYASDAFSRAVRASKLEERKG